MEIKKIFNPNCSEWNEEVGSSNYYPEDAMTVIEEMEEEIERRNKEGEWDEDRNRN